MSIKFLEGQLIQELSQFVGAYTLGRPWDDPAYNPGNFAQLNTKSQLKKLLAEEKRWSAGLRANNNMLNLQFHAEDQENKVHLYILKCVHQAAPKTHFSVLNMGYIWHLHVQATGATLSSEHKFEVFGLSKGDKVLAADPDGFQTVGGRNTRTV